MSKSADSPVKILLADDSVTMHRAVSLALKKESYELVCVDNGKDALRLAYEHRPQIMLLDLDMPEKSGIEVAQEIRNDPSLAGIQIVLLCGSFDEINEKDIEKAPVDARLWKPFESHVLLAMLRTLVSSRAPSSPSASVTIAPTEASESTAPHAAAPSPAPKRPSQAAAPKSQLAKPKIPLPKSRKDEALENAALDAEDQASALSSSPTEQRQVKQSAEATRPLSVSDLFDPSKRPAPQGPDLLAQFASEETGGDFTKELARETFSSFQVPEELPEPTAAALAIEKTRAPVTPQPKEDPFVNNLWSPEELSSYEEESSFAPDAVPDSPTNPSGVEIDFEVLDPNRLSAEPTTSAHRIEPGEAPWSAPSDDAATRDIPASTLRERTNALATEVMATATGAVPDDLRRVVADEVRRAFNGWLKDELQRQLNEVMAELDNERT
jgi:DNA-binding response OmpR family regulator